MKTSTVMTLVAVSLAAALAFFVYRSFQGPDPKYWIARGIYDRDVAAGDAQHVKDLGEIGQWRRDDAEKTVQLAEANKKIEAMKAVVTTTDTAILGLEAQNKKLRGDAQAAIDANPALQALVANFDLTIAKYKEQNVTLKAIIDGQDHQVNLWQGRYEDMERQAKSWEAEYNREHALRLTCDSLRIKAEGAGRSNSTIAKVEGAVILGAAAYLGGKALKIW